ncbi:protein SGT1 homolog isoform X2 [Paramacrobiotus metropolitanus]|uniref:protein SGT1 homolog isoform X2 n=1 Tax=Paramacrobiotus metropolitanus TaxID=2943436 RepID=UPI002446417D|nr:protein SGT1 homolog isoform X2 [Paramacrobiotus metropolitanus]
MASEEVESRGKTPRFEWYQTDGSVVISFFVKGVQEANLSVHCRPDTLDFKSVDDAGELYVAQLNLAHTVKESCENKILRSKVEIKLLKNEAIRWEQLERKIQEKDAALPGSNQKWNQIEKELKAAEADEKPEGDAALMKLFQDIYGGGSDEVKKAMMKSFYESNGTVLSTNWQEVGEKTVDVKAPDGMEYKKWSP